MAPPKRFAGGQIGGIVGGRASGRFGEHIARHAAGIGQELTDVVAGAQDAGIERNAVDLIPAVPFAWLPTRAVSLV